MQFPGECKLTLTLPALCAAIEDSLNAARRDGEDYVRCTGVRSEGYGYGDYIATITTDRPAACEPITIGIDSTEAA